LTVVGNTENSLKSLVGTAGRFAIVGSCSFFIYLLAVALLVHFGVIYWLAGIIAYTLFTPVSYLFQFHWTFGSDRQHLTTFPLFVAIHFIGILVNGFVLWMLMEYFQIGVMVSQVSALILIVLVSFVLQRYVVFGGARS
jgi:putative flippase GtrA